MYVAKHSIGKAAPGEMLEAHMLGDDANIKRLLTLGAIERVERPDVKVVGEKSMQQPEKQQAKK